MRVKYKDGHNTHYASTRTTFRSTSFKTYLEGKFVQTHNASRLEPVFILQKYKQTNYKNFAQVAQTDNASLVLKRPMCFFRIVYFFKKNLFNRFDRFLLFSNSKFYLPGTLSGLVRNFFFSIHSLVNEDIYQYSKS